MRRRAVTRLLCCALLVAARAWEVGPSQAAPGEMLAPAADDLDDVEGPPLGISWLAPVFGGDCRRCLKACLGAKVQRAQVAAMKVQAPLSLVTFYLFKNRPFQMWPLEDALRAVSNVHPAAWGAAASAAYMSCRADCELDCPYPRAPGADARPEYMRDLDAVNPSDTGFLSRLYQGGQQKKQGSFAQAVSEMFTLG